MAGQRLCGGQPAGSPFVIAILTTVLALPVFAQQAMPDASQMAGVPLPAPELPDGTVTVRLMRERIGNNIVGHPVTLKAGQDTRSGKTDEQGRAQFTGLPPGVTVVAEATVDGEALKSQEFPTPPRGGVRVALIAGIAEAAARARAAAEAAAKEPPRQGIVTFGGDSRVILEFQDDRLQVFYLLDIVNSARTPIDTGGPLVVELPAAATSATLMQGSSKLAVVNGKGVTITGPFPPGITAVQLGYTLPNNDDSLTLTQTWPAAMDQVFVAIEKIGNLQMSSPQLPEVQDADASGTTFVMGRGQRLNAGQPLTLQISGLPHRNRIVTQVGFGVALLVLAIGLWAAFSAQPARNAHAAGLAARKEKLFRDLVELERQRAAGRLDEKRFATKRQALMTELERVLGELDRSPSGGGEGLAA